MASRSVTQEVNMKAKSAINKIKKRLGIDVSDQVKDVVSGNAASRKVVIPWKDHVLSFYVDHSYTAGSAKINLIHIRRENDLSDLMTDYHAGYFPDNLTQALDAIEPPEPKFPAGSLVRVKSTKRAVRFNIAGISGLVVNAGPHSVKILNNSYGNVTSWIRNNDVELVQL